MAIHDCGWTDAKMNADTNPLITTDPARPNEALVPRK